VIVTDRDVGWFRDTDGCGVLVTHLAAGDVLGFPARPGMVNEYIGRVPHAWLRTTLEQADWNWREPGSYERLRALVKNPPDTEEW
jgi:hypothetical protein